MRCADKPDHRTRQGLDRRENKKDKTNRIGKKENTSALVNVEKTMAWTDFECGGFFIECLFEKLPNVVSFCTHPCQRAIE